jgi:hypothetical protein
MLLSVVGTQRPWTSKEINKTEAQGNWRVDWRIGYQSTEQENPVHGQGIQFSVAIAIIKLSLSVTCMVGLIKARL